MIELHSIPSGNYTDEEWAQLWDCLVYLEIPSNEVCYTRPGHIAWRATSFSNGSTLWEEFFSSTLMDTISKWERAGSPKDFVKDSLAPLAETDFVRIEDGIISGKNVLLGIDFVFLPWEDLPHDEEFEEEEEEEEEEEV